MRTIDAREGDVEMRCVESAVVGESGGGSGGGRGCKGGRGCRSNDVLLISMLVACGLAENLLLLTWPEVVLLARLRSFPIGTSQAFT